MARIFRCDNCKKEFPEPLDQEVYKDEHGVTHMIDLCAPCRGKLAEKRKTSDKDFLAKLVKKL